MTPTGNSYVSVQKSRFFADRNKDASVVSISKPSESLTRASPPMTNLLDSFHSTFVLSSEEALASPDLTDFTLVDNKKAKKNSTTKQIIPTPKQKRSKISPTSPLKLVTLFQQKITNRKSICRNFETTKILLLTLLYLMAAPP
ncbi:hypothetical protein AVEN_267206-1 [Araneus ventricosus]|uniref:Uncharacterized protein n=1 Tax=Araneus ventricosus TaxID=182803 RepID=A0A4Y2AAA3_ARAVE|nr:hypothetical protein AVEN_267206-1 [Araneus ventricosus]